MKSVLSRYGRKIRGQFVCIEVGNVYRLTDRGLNYVHVALEYVAKTACMLRAAKVHICA